MQYNLAHGDTIAVRRELQRQAALRTRARSGDVAINGTYAEARAWLQLHDTAAAIATLDHSLHALPTLGSYLLEQPEQVGCAIRAMALRADLAARAGDHATASLWGRAVAPCGAMRIHRCVPPWRVCMNSFNSLPVSRRGGAMRGRCWCSPGVWY